MLFYFIVFLSSKHFHLSFIFLMIISLFFFTFFSTNSFSIQLIHQTIYSVFLNIRLRTIQHLKDNHGKVLLLKWGWMRSVVWMKEKAIGNKYYKNKDLSTYNHNGCNLNSFTLTQNIPNQHMNKYQA